MKKLLLSLIAVAGAWTSAGAQTELKGYKLVEENGKTITLDKNVTLSGKACYASNSNDRFTLTSQQNVSTSGNNIKIYTFEKDGLISFGSKASTSVDLTWTPETNHYINVSQVDLTGRSYMGCTVECNIDGKGSTTIDNSTNNDSKNVSLQAVYSPAKETAPITIYYNKDGRSGTFSGVGEVYIASLKVTYNKYHYTLDFTKADNLMSQAEALYNSLSAESKGSAEGVALLDAKNTTATFKTAHEGEAVDVKTGALRAELTADENAIQAAIDAFTCNLADTDEYTVPGKTVTNITLTRAIKANTWNTLCLPFDMEIPAGWTVKELSGVSYNSAADSYDAQFSTASSIVAGKPYIVKVSTEVPEITRNDAAGFKLAAALTPVEKSDNGGTLTFTGVFAPQNLANCYFISGGKFYYATPGKGNTTKAYRALFTIVGPSSSAKLVYTVDGDEVTLIDAPELVPANDAPVFDLQGRRVNAPVSGKLYIKNGKKFVQQ